MNTTDLDTYEVFLLTHGFCESADAGPDSYYIGCDYYFVQQLVGDGTADLFEGKLTKNARQFRTTIDTCRQWRDEREMFGSRIITWDVGQWCCACLAHYPLALQVDLDIQSFYLGLQHCVEGLPDPPRPAVAFGDIEALKTRAKYEKRLVELLFNLRPGSQENETVVAEIQKLSG